MLKLTMRGVLVIAALAWAVDLARAENHADQPTLDTWASQRLSGDVAQVPFSFKYGDISSADLLRRSKFEHQEKQLDANRVERVLTWNDPETGLEVRCDAIQYKDSPFVEWTLHFTNKSDKDTPILSDIKAVDIAFDREGEREVVLHHYKGSRATPDDFRPRETSLDEGLNVKLRSIGGRGTDGTMPYFNLEGPNKGMLLAIGWPGQWEASFQRNIGVNLHITAGQEQTHFKLLPGETVRSPLIAIGFYTGNPQNGQNVWRRWMVAHNLPRVDGEVMPTQLVACSSHQFGEMLNANEENQKLFVDRYAEEKLGIAYWWMDAGWYPNDGSWVNTGTWEVDKKRFPNGLRPITDHARSKGIKAIVWFEPERVTANSWLYDNKPEWLLTPPPNPGDQLYDQAWRLLDLGNPEALAWLIDHVGKIIDKEGIDLYRQDFNVNPLMFWRAADAPDRQGISEIKYVTGYLAYWDALINNHPGMRIRSVRFPQPHGLQRNGLLGHAGQESRLR
jgi:alpha-galactosidase